MTDKPRTAIEHLRHLQDCRMEYELACARLAACKRAISQEMLHEMYAAAGFMVIVEPADRRQYREANYLVVRDGVVVGTVHGPSDERHSDQDLRDLLKLIEEGTDEQA